jgi:hypothetical protein
VKLSLGDLIVPALLVGVLGWWGYGKWSDRVTQAEAGKARLEAMARDDRALADIARTHQATRALTDKLADGGSKVLTYQVQNALRVPTGGAVIISGSLVDVALSGGKYELLVEDRTSDAMTLRYQLACEPAVATKILAKRSDSAVISAAVVISAVERSESRFDTGAKPASGTTDVPVLFLARGQCLDAVVR